MPTPPPFPEQKPIQRAVFNESKKMRLGNVTFDYALIEASHEKAEAWINENLGIEIVQIQTFNSSMLGITVVWYR
jgi:translation initiation factor 6 (eIF-6)